MRTSLRARLATACLSVSLGAAALAQPTPLTTAFTYQGELASAGSAATGSYDIRFRLYDAATGGTQVGSTLCSDNLAVSNGRFAASLDFGSVFSGQKRFLEIEVRPDTGLDCSDATGYTVLSPRQELTAAPNATFAQNAATATTATNATSLNGQSPSFYQNAANLTGTLADAQLSTNIARLNSNQTFTGLLNFTNAGNTFAGNGAGLTNLGGASINAGTLPRSALSTDVQTGVGSLVPDLSPTGSISTGSLPQSVAVSGSFAYVVNQFSNTLQVFNISSPAAPTLAGSVATGAQPSSVAVSGSFAYVVNQTPATLQVFNISNPAAPAPAGSVATGAQPSSVAVSGSFAYVVNGNSNTLQIFNISSPAAPTLAGSVATGGGSRCVAVSGSFAYVVNGNSNTLQAFNISNPAAVTLAGSVATGNFPISVAVSGSFAYVVNFSSSTLQVFNTASRVGFSTPLAASSLSGVNGAGLTGLNASNITTGTLSPAQIPNLDAAKITTGTIADARIPANFARETTANAFGNFTNTFAGDVGIGIGAPTSRLHVRGDGTGGRVVIDPGAANLDSEIGLYENTSNSLGAILRYNGSVNQFQIIGVTSGVELTLATFDRDGSGSVNVPVTFSAASKAFRIDHPLDPENKELWHSCVESPDMKNIYDGVVTTDARGYAIVELPDYFEALNRDFRYQLTVVDDSENDFILTKVYRKIGVDAPRQFTIKSSMPNIEVSWQVTGIRQDAWAQKNRIPNSIDKPATEKGTLLHPEAFGKPAAQGKHTQPVAERQSVSDR